MMFECMYDMVMRIDLSLSWFKASSMQCILGYVVALCNNIL